MDWQYLTHFNTSKRYIKFNMNADSKKNSETERAMISFP